MAKGREGKFAGQRTKGHAAMEPWQDVLCAEVRPERATSTFRAEACEETLAAWPPVCQSVQNPSSQRHGRRRPVYETPSIM